MIGQNELYSYLSIEHLLSFSYVNIKIKMATTSSSNSFRFPYKHASNFYIIHNCSSRRARASFPIRFNLRFQTTFFATQDLVEATKSEKCNANDYKSSSS